MRELVTSALVIAFVGETLVRGDVVIEELVIGEVVREAVVTSEVV